MNALSIVLLLLFPGPVSDLTQTAPPKYLVVVQSQNGATEQVFECDKKPLVAASRVTIFESDGSETVLFPAPGDNVKTLPWLGSLPKDAPSLASKVGTPVKRTPDTNVCRAYGLGGGWSYYLTENYDANTPPDGKLDYTIGFIHRTIGMLTGTLDHAKSVYNAQKQTAEVWGVGTFRGKPVVIKAVQTKTDGLYGRGQLFLDAYDDVNRNGSLDAGEPQIFPVRTGITAYYTLLTFAPTQTPQD